MYYETSAKTRDNVEEIFHQIVREIKNEEIYYFTGNGIEKLFQINKIENLNFQIPQINKNLKNVWMIIFKFVFLNNKSQRLVCKVVCKYWYNFIIDYFETKNYNQKIFLFDNSFLNISSSFSPLNCSYLKKLIFVFDLCHYLRKLPDFDIQILKNLKFEKKKILIIFFNSKLFKETFEKESFHQVSWKFNNAKKNLDSLIKQFSSWKSLVVEDLSKKNLITISKKIDNKKHKFFLEKMDSKN